MKFHTYIDMYPPRCPVNQLIFMYIKCLSINIYVYMIFHLHFGSRLSAKS